MYTDKISGILTRKELCIDASEQWSRAQRLEESQARRVIHLADAPLAVRLTSFGLTQQWVQSGPARLN